MRSICSRIPVVSLMASLAMLALCPSQARSQLSKDYFDLRVTAPTSKNFEVEDFGRDVVELTKAIHSASQNPQLYIKRSLAFSERGDFDFAIIDLNTAILLDNANYLAYYNRAVAWHHEKNYEKALTDYSEAIRLKPDNPLAYEAGPPHQDSDLP